MDTCLQDPNPCRVIGVLDDGAASLNATALAYLRHADVVIGGARTLALLARELKPGALRHDLTGQLKAVPEWVRLEWVRPGRVRPTSPVSWARSRTSSTAGSSTRRTSSPSARW